MLRVARYHTIPLPNGWPQRVRSAVIWVIYLARAAGRIHFLGFELGLLGTVYFCWTTTPGGSYHFAHRGLPA